MVVPGAGAGGYEMRERENPYKQLLRGGNRKGIPGYGGVSEKPVVKIGREFGDGGVSRRNHLLYDGRGDLKEFDSRLGVSIGLGNHYDLAA
jgi:hypothetical protein